MSFREDNAKQCWAPLICWPYATLYQRLYWSWDSESEPRISSFFHPRSIPLMSFMEANAKQCWTSWYADLVPVCIREGPGPRIQSSGFHLLWVQEPRPSSCMSFREANVKQCWAALDMVTLCHSVSETLFGPGIQSLGFHLLCVQEPRTSPFMSFKEAYATQFLTPWICWPCATLYHRLSWSGFQSLGFHLLWVHEPRLGLLWVSYKHVQNSVGHPQNADLVPYCICPGIQSSWFHLLWVHEPRCSPL